MREANQPAGDESRTGDVGVKSATRTRGCRPLCGGAGAEPPHSEEQRGARASASKAARSAKRTRQAPSPGSSNTRALTPAVLEQEPANGTNSRSFSSAGRLLACRVDALKIAFRLELDREVVLRLAAGRLEAEVADCSVPFSVAGETLELLEKGAARKDFHLRNADFDLFVGEDERGYCVVVEARAVLLATENLSSVVDRMRSFAAFFADGPVEDERVRRIDLCADVTGVPFNQRDVEAFVGRVRKTAEFGAFSISGREGPRYTGFRFGSRGKLMVRLYDKVEQLRSQFGVESEKWRTETAAYALAGWNGRSPIWRLEAEIQGKALDELSLRDPTNLQDKLDSAWRYLFGTPGSKVAWLRLADLDTATRRERCATDPRWTFFQQAVFDRPDCSPAERVKGSRGGAPIAQVAGAMRGALAARGQLPDMPPDATAEELVMADSLAFAEEIKSDAELLKSYKERRPGTQARFASLSDGARPFAQRPQRFVSTHFDEVTAPLEWREDDAP